MNEKRIKHLFIGADKDIRIEVYSTSGACLGTAHIPFNEALKLCQGRNMDILPESSIIYLDSTGPIAELHYYPAQVKKAIREKAIYIIDQALAALEIS